MEISDPKVIRALAHPLRLDLLELLAAISPATAARCGRILGIPQANCSFHLRQLAKYGFVEDAGPGRDRRERQWRVPDPRPTLRIAGSDAVVRRQLERVVVEREAQAILDYAERQDDESSAWRHKAGIVTAIAVVSADDVAEIRDKWKALLEPYLARTEAGGQQLRPGQRHVRYFMAATPTPDLDSGDNENESDD
ncbi:winged helix-turn-helix domain-containing protein [Sphaerisporangium perillae]|uniref:winged helix-turn-helix domain-containing protein n=1 Tax=Sphaerisporangium perillae TaxID=2935860 RepID=UPI00200DE4EB|nr:helix-turn-helix domain-containing protein [Sphaerisporangium perillae]